MSDKKTFILAAGLLLVFANAVTSGELAYLWGVTSGAIAPNGTPNGPASPGSGTYPYSNTPPPGAGTPGATLRPPTDLGGYRAQ